MSYLSYLLFSDPGYLVIPGSEREFNELKSIFNNNDKIWIGYNAIGASGVTKYININTKTKMKYLIFEEL